MNLVLIYQKGILGSLKRGSGIKKLPDVGGKIDVKYYNQRLKGLHSLMPNG
jgi:hypothetical protein